MINPALARVRNDYTLKYNVSLSSILNISKSEDTALETFSSALTTYESTPMEERLVTTASQTPEMLWEKVNKQYREQINSLSLTQHSSDLDDIYSIVPELIDPKIPLRTSLELIEATGSISKKALTTIKKAEVGLSGRVKFVRFKNDRILDRWFAIKRPMSLVQRIFKSGNHIHLALKRYENNLSMALKIGNHPNFMKVYGIVVKEKSGKEAKPYLILEYIDGIRLRDIEYLPLTDCLKVLSQLRSALVHLLEIGIFPVDANHGNFLITKSNLLKIIDFDAWKESAVSKQLAQGLYGIACSVAKKLSGESNFNPPPFTTSGLNIKQDLEKSISNLINQFSMYLGI